MIQEATPMMAQYLGIKARYENVLLFYRMGDFFELFFEDARIASEVLDITLTTRGKHMDEAIPMCGVPVHAAEAYLHDLVRAGHHVAICEQVETPREAKKRGPKAVVQREVVRLVTPGTLTEESLLEKRAANHLGAYVALREGAALAWADISTGLFYVTHIEDDLDVFIEAVGIKELIIPMGEDESPFSAFVSHISPIARSSFDIAGATKKLCDFYQVSTLDSFGAFSRAHLAAMGGLVDYLSLTQLDRPARLRPPVLIASGSHMRIDAATRRNLEISQTLSGARAGSLLSVIDKTLTAMGARALAARLRAPLLDLERIRARHDRIAAMDTSSSSELRDILRLCPDFERAATRVLMGRGGPRDLRVIADGLRFGGALAPLVADMPELAEIRQDLGLLSWLGTDWDTQLVAMPPVLVRDGDFVAKGVNAQLDQLRDLRDNTRAIIAQKQKIYQDLSGIQALKIKYNNVLGYFIETPATHMRHMLGDEMRAHFIHRQTTANALRFTTQDLAALETEIMGASEAALMMERKIFEGWVNTLEQNQDALSKVALAVAEIDILQNIQLLASMGWCRPEMSMDESFYIEAGRHPVVEAAMPQGAVGFVANDCHLEKDPGNLWLITGPNMAGKSTYLRQNALMAILAQAGFYVPARVARIGLVDQIFSRIGASDDLARGRSTFMVEMIETATILNQATSKSLVILDEIGRGTATYDGLAIAWAVLEYLLDQNRCRGLFATHFHELTALGAHYPMLHTAHVTVSEWEEKIVFLYEVRDGCAQRSYGVDVARLAGMPMSVIKRARVLLDRLENQDQTDLKALPLFATHSEPEKQQAQPSAVIAALCALSPDFMTPREALDQLYRLHQEAVTEVRGK